MANCSSAYGNMYITTDKEKVNKIVGIFDNFCSHWYYDTCVNVFFDGGDGTVEGTFDGNGRWTFQENINSWGRWILEDDKIPEETKQFLTENEFSIRYQYSDWEPGCEVLYEAEATYNHPAGVPLGDVEVSWGDFEDYEYSFKNLLRRDVMDYTSLANDVEEWFDNGGWGGDDCLAVEVRGLDEEPFSVYALPNNDEYMAEVKNDTDDALKITHAEDGTVFILPAHSAILLGENEKEHIVDFALGFEMYNVEEI